MPIEQRGEAHVVTHALARDTLSQLRDVNTDQTAFRKGLVKLGRVCGYEIVDGELETEYVEIQTPLTETMGERVTGIDDVVIVNVLRAATPFVEGLLKAFPRARQGVISASRDESNRYETGSFPVTVDYVKLPDIGEDDVVVVADPMLATGSTMNAVLSRVLAGSNPAETFALSAVAAPEGLMRVGDSHPDVTRLTVAVDDGLDDDGYIVPGLGDAGDRAYGTTDG